MKQYIYLGKKALDLTEPLVMGILNITQDSFYDGGKYFSEVNIVERIHQIIEQGASIIDVGAYSTRPGAKDIEKNEEISRLSFALELVRKYYPEFPISIDTFRSEVASEISKCFGDIIVNDISGGTMDDKMFDFISSSKLPYIMMHIVGTPQTMQNNPSYKDVTSEVKEFFRDRIEQLKKYNYNNLILDPGFGFGKSIEHNYTLLRKMAELNEFNLPILVGVSRKSMIYKLLSTSASQALNGTSILHAFALERGAKILRVHDVEEAVEVTKLYKALLT